MAEPILVVHGGAWNIPDDWVEPHLKGVQHAVQAGWSLLAKGGTAVDAVEAAIVVMEDDETFDAGRGAFLTSEAHVQLDALMMDGFTLRAGGVGCVERIRNPIRAARKVLDESPHVYLVAEGAEKFAAQHGIPLIDNRELIIPREIERLKEAQLAARSGKPPEFFAEHDTVGAIALDRDGRIAAATSTGGTMNKTPGRVGDSSLIGCGCYADNESAAVSTTGWGEPMMKLVLGKWACDRVAEGKSPDVAARMSIDILERRLNGHGGLILLDPKGRYGMWHNTPRMAWALRSAAEVKSGITCR